MHVSLERVREHLRVDHNEEDELIEHYIEASEAHLTSIGVDLDQDPLPSSIELAILLLVAHFYENREAAGKPMSKTPIGVSTLVAPYRESVE